MAMGFTTVDLADLRFFLSKLSPIAHAEQERIISLIDKIDKQLAKGNHNHETRRNNQSRTAA